MLAKVDSCSVVGIDGFVVQVEVDISYGLPVFNIVGLPEASIRESKDRVRSAIKNSGYTFPMDRVVVNLAPADVKKEGTGFDLAIAIAVLAASELISPDSAAPYLMTGELSLDGQVKPVKAVLPFALSARACGLRGIIVPHENADEAALVKGIEVLPVKHLSQVVDFLSGFTKIESHIPGPVKNRSKDMGAGLDFSEVRGQPLAKRALEIAACGSHNVMMSGPPGSGKSMLAKRLPTILPRLSLDEALDVTRIQSVTGEIDDGVLYSHIRPFRSPHHTISGAGLVGGGTRPVPGEISLAHHGVLFLDELPEFKKSALEGLRQPLEDGVVTISRANVKATYPARFMLVAAMNPCPCGYFSDPSGRCNCSSVQVKNYSARVSGPLMDRIDIQIEVPRLAYKDLASGPEGDSSAIMRKRVENAVGIQTRRLSGTGILNNAKMHARHLNRFCGLDSAGDKMLGRAVDMFGLSARACHSVLRVARTIADLEASEAIQTSHLAEAIGYRSFDRSCA